MANELKINEFVTLEPTIMDTGDSTYIYYGYAAPNSNASALTQCSIKRVNLDTNLVEWAGGNPYAFSYAWTARATDLSYSPRNTT